MIQFLLVFLLSLSLTAVVRYYAVSRRMLDIPNERSSHSAPTPRGGGLAIVAAFAAACFYMFFNQQLDAARCAAFSTALLVAVIGFCDDRAHVAARWRFLTHLLAAFSALYFMNGLPLLLIPAPLAGLIGAPSLQLGWLGILPGVLLLVWLLNLFNFMDGADGIAASEAVFVCSAMAAYLFSIDYALYAVFMSLAAAALGFLFWNWPKARIFMGDVGSGYLGLIIGMLIFMAARQSPVLLYCGLILFGLFVTDASYTLLIRIATGQKWYAAHCSHTYQRAAKRYGHATVLLVSWAINIGWLLPISWLVFLFPSSALLGMAIAYLPLIGLARRFKAGLAEIKT